MDKRHTGVVKTLKIIGSKWTVLILCHLKDGTMRFGQLQRALDGISPKTLSIRLQQLEKQGIIQKKVYPEIPPRTEYSMTKNGKTLGGIIASMQEWGEEHRVRV
jgi:DNA-binding HxlR family transcriptional regulator